MEVGTVVEELNGLLLIWKFTWRVRDNQEGAVNKDNVGEMLGRSHSVTVAELDKADAGLHWDGNISTEIKTKLNISLRRNQDMERKNNTFVLIMFQEDYQLDSVNLAADNSNFLISIARLIC